MPFSASVEPLTAGGNFPLAPSMGVVEAGGRIAIGAGGGASAAEGAEGRADKSGL